MRRRALLLNTATLLLAAPFATSRAAARPAQLAAAWDDDQGRHFAGLLAGSDAAPLRVLRQIALPTRAHGLWVEPGGSLLVVARRPGDWLLRWHPGGAPTRWLWSEPERRFAGHVVADRLHQRLFSTEADLDSGTGRIVVRDAGSLQVLHDWPSGGIDAHQLMQDADGSLLVANGGVPTLAETGRLKLARDGMDPSLARLDARTGRLLGQWRLADPRLSIRHLARHADGTVGIALQAEHDDAAARANAPLLALFDGRALRTAAQARPLAGYGGDIAATGTGFVVAATRAGGLAHWDERGGWSGFTPLPDACALAMDDGELWAGGSAAALQAADRTSARPHPVARLRLDNHWVAWQRAGRSASAYRKTTAA